MKPKTTILATIFILSFISLTLCFNYDGYKVYKVAPKNEVDNRLLINLEENRNFDFWSKANKLFRPVSVMVAPTEQKTFEKLLKIRNISFEVLIENIETTIQAERAYHISRGFKDGHKITFDQFYRYDDINTYLEQLANDYPNLVTVEDIGKSYENRSMNLIRISSGGSPKPVIFIDGGIHAREWISPAVCLYIINQLVENEAYKSLLDKVDWAVLPVLNPDGYEYTFEEDRFWRKTLSPGALCDGVDANRNFGYHWNEEGASSYECADDYAGPAAFSESEARNVRDYLSKTDNIKAYLSFHSYAQLILYPYAYGVVFPDNKDELEELGLKIKDTIAAVAGRKYDVGSPPTVLYAAPGASMDWAAAPQGANISLVYTIELPGGGSFGFDLPPQDILGVVEERWKGVMVLHDHVAQKN